MRIGSKEIPANLNKEAMGRETVVPKAKDIEYYEGGHDVSMISRGSIGSRYRDTTTRNDNRERRFGRQTQYDSQTG